jgi:hypothetical protein
MRSRAPSAPFEPVSIIGESVTIETKGKILVLPTGNPLLLPYNNEYTLTPGRSLPTTGIYTFTDDYDSETGLKNLTYPWIALLSLTSSDIDFFLFTHRPKKLQYKVEAIKSGYEQFLTSDSNTFLTSDLKNFYVIYYEDFITKLVLYPGNGMIYHGQITYPSITLDSNSDFVPDVFDINIIGSLTKFLQPYGCVDGRIGTQQFLTSNFSDFLTSDKKYLFVRA